MIYNKANDGEKVNLFYAKFKIFILMIYKINKYLKSVFTLNAFQDFFCSAKVSIAYTRLIPYTF